MTPRLNVALVAAAIVSLYSCNNSGPEPDAQIYGYITVWETMGRGSIVSLTNGGAETQLMLDEDTELVRTFGQDGKAPMWYFDSAYRVDGRMNWAPEEYFDATGNVVVPRLSGSRDWIWATRVERLGEPDARALIESGALIAKGIKVDSDWLVECFERAERTVAEEDELEAARRSCFTRQGSSAGGEE